MALILDTGPIVALLNAGDRHHDRCVRLVRESRETFVVPAATLGEVDYFLRKFDLPAAWRVFAEDIAAGAYLLEATTEEDLVRAAELEEQYADLRLGFVDAAVIALCERMREPKVVTIDRRHFSVVTPRHVEALELLPH
jgi:uncharacterized protein